MSSLRHLHSKLTTGAPGFLKVLINILFLPYFIWRFFRILNSTLESESGVHELSREDLDERLKLSIAHTDPITEAISEYATQAVSLIEGLEWEALETLLAQSELSRSFVLGQTYRHAVSDRIWEALTDPYVAARDRDHPLGERDVPDNILDPFRAAIEEQDRPHVALLTVDLLVQLSWARYGGLFAKNTEFDPLSEQAAALGEAQGILATLPQETQEQPDYARATFLANAGIVPTSETVTLFWQWQKSDPTSLEPYQMLGLFLLPQWTDDETWFIDLAPDVYEASKTHLTAAAYAAYALTAVKREGENRYHALDLDLMVSGIKDLIRLSPDRDIAVNQLCGFLYFASMDEGDLFGEEAHDQRTVHQMLRTEFERLVRTELDVVYPHWWEESEQTTLYAIAEVFEVELIGGETVRLGRSQK